MSATSGFETQSATLLVVDDDAGAREGLRSVFESAGHRTIGVPDAPAALRLLRKEQCDLIMLDVELPEVDGLALCRLLRAQPSMRQLPVLVFSSSDSEHRKIEAFSAGADDYIVKPSTPGELISRVNSHLNMAQRESDLLGSNRELRFLADLGRGLLQTLEPEQVARRVAGATLKVRMSRCAPARYETAAMGWPSALSTVRATRRRLEWSTSIGSKPGWPRLVPARPHC